MKDKSTILKHVNILSDFRHVFSDQKNTII